MLSVLSPALVAADEPDEFDYEGWPLAQALEDLRQRGLRLLYGSNVVKPEMRVEAAPSESRARAVADEILAPHGLMLRRGRNGVLTVVSAAPGRVVGNVRYADSDEPAEGAEIELIGVTVVRAGADGRFTFSEVPPGYKEIEARQAGFVIDRRMIDVPPADEIEVHLSLEPVSNTLEEIVVTPGQVSILPSEPTSEIHWTREQVHRLPHLSDDLFRAVARLPGVTKGDFSADFHVRGGERNEVLILIDGLRVYEPYHLRDFQNVFSIFDTNAIESVEVMKGGFAAAYGDRMGGVVEISSRIPEAQLTMIGLSFEKAYAMSTGRFSDAQRDWLVSARRGYLDLILDISRREGDDFDLRPSYWDVFAKMRSPVGRSGLVAFHVLAARDSTEFFSDTDDDDLTSSYRSAYAWASYESLVGRRGSQSTLVSYGSLASRREGESGANVSDPNPDPMIDQTVVSDRRDSIAVQLDHAWRFDLTPRQFLVAGATVRRLEADYDYSSFNVVTDPVFTDTPIVTLRRLEPAPEGWTMGIHLSDRFRIGRGVTAEIGARWDRQTYIDDSQLSPRLNLVAQVSANTTLRAAWGDYYQSQDIYELQVEDGVEEFFPAQLNRQTIVGVDYRLGLRSLFSAQLYSKRLRDPRPRFETLYQVIDPFPEGQSDRVLVAPERGRAYGFEVYVQSRRGSVDWWLGYTLSKAEDLIDDEWTPRSWDERHAFTYSVNLSLGKFWNINFAGVHHTGWPATDATLVQQPGDPVPRLSPTPRNSTSFPAYHRLDVRASRTIPLNSSEIKLYFEVTNLLNRDNIRSVSDFELAAGPDGFGITREFEIWFPRIPSFGVSWSF